MYIGCCENCKYVDLVENVTGVCPRCGGIIESCGIESSAWNAMGDDERAKIIAGKFSEDDEITNVIDVNKTDAIADEADAEQEITRDIQETETEETEVPDAPEAEEAEAKSEEGTSVETEEATEHKETTESGEDLEDDTKDDEYNDEEYDSDDIKRVYVCYKCSSVATHSGRQDTYYCKECGSDMVDVGYTADKWAMLTKEEKRNVTEDAKIKHMVLKIKNTTYDDEENVTTQNIINVVRE
ncbi:MAG: hypothetical protein E7298_13835 [Lachnospiraceae bacterium]|nr:hypothetical protein [Lachnospiraceae bacterium]